MCVLCLWVAYSVVSLVHVWCVCGVSVVYVYCMCCVCVVRIVSVLYIWFVCCIVMWVMKILCVHAVFSVCV